MNHWEGRRGGLVAAVVAAVLGFGPAAHAAEKGTAVAVAASPGVESRASTISYVLQSVVRQSPRFDLVDLAARAEGAAAQKRQQKAEDAASAFTQAKKAYDQLDLAGALSGFEQSVTDYQASDLTAHMQDLLRSLSMLAATRYFNGDVDGARQALERLLSLNADFHFDLSTFSPPLQKMAKDVARQLKPQRQEPLEIHSRPVSARIYVDGRFAGMAPQVLKDLAPGRHYVSAVAPGYAFVQRQVKADPGALDKIALKPADDGGPLLRDLAALKTAFRGGDVAPAAKQLARWAGVDEILVAAVSRAGTGNLEVSAARVAKDGHVLAVGKTTLQLADPKAMATLAQWAMSLYQKDLPRGPGGAPVDTRVSTPAQPLGPLWGYVTGGTGVALLAAGTVFAIQAKGSADKAKKIPQVNQADIKTTVGTARTQALLADTFLGLGAVGVGVGIYLVIPKGGSGGSDQGSSDDSGDDFFSLAPVPLPGGAAVLATGRF